MILEFKHPFIIEMIGSLRDEIPDDIEQDLIQITLPNQIFVDIGWNGETKEYKIAVFKETWDNQLQGMIFCKTPIAAHLIAKQLIKRYTTPRKLNKCTLNSCKK